MKTALCLGLKVFSTVSADLHLKVTMRSHPPTGFQWCERTVEIVLLRDGGGFNRGSSLLSLPAENG
jgi:hypothetical protein